MASEADVAVTAAPTRSAAGHRVVMIEDHGMVAAALGGVLGTEPDIDLVAIAATVPAGIDAVARLRPDVVVTDLHLADGVVTDHLGALRASSKRSRIMIVTGAPSEKSLLDALEGGVTGFVDKSQPIDDFVDAVRRVARGEFVVSPALAPVLVAHAGGRRHDRSTLTPRELEILELLARGASTESIAGSLCVSAHTVRNHVARILMKLRAHSRLEAVSKASQRGLISPR